MTILAFLALLFGVCLVFDGAFQRGVLVRVFPDARTATLSAIRMFEVLTGGLIFVVLGFALSSC